MQEKSSGIKDGSCADENTQDADKSRRERIPWRDALTCFFVIDIRVITL